jgi:hypothetical protein
MPDVVAFVPSAAEHERAVAAMEGLGRPLAEVLPRLPDFLALNALAALILATGAGTLAPATVAGILVSVSMFCLGVGIGRRRQRAPIAWRVDADGISIDRPRRGLRIPWARIEAVDETAEFFFVRVAVVSYYLPKRALSDADADALRSRLGQVLTERATLNPNVLDR